MSTQYLIRAAPVLQHFGFDNSMIPKELFEQAERGAYESGRERDYFVIGTSFCNGKVDFLIHPNNYSGILALIARGEGLTYLTEEDIHRVIESEKPYYSKLERESSPLLHTKHRRFFWHTAGRDFWEPLSGDIRVATQDLKVNTLGELMDGLYSPNAYMDAVENVCQGEYKGDPTVFPSWWVEFGGVPNKESQVESSPEHNQEKCLRTLDRILDANAILQALEIFGYQTQSTRPNFILAQEKEQSGEDGRAYLFRVYDGRTTIEGGILTRAEPVFDISEESDISYWNRGLDDIIEEHDLQERISNKV